MLSAALELLLVDRELGAVVHKALVAAHEFALCAFQFAALALVSLSSFLPTQSNAAEQLAAACAFGCAVVSVVLGSIFPVLESFSPVGLVVACFAYSQELALHIVRSLLQSGKLLTKLSC